MRERDRVAAAIKARAAPPAAPPKEELPAPLPPVGQDPAYKLGELAEKQLRLYDSRDLFREAIRSNPDAAGVLEHAAWFSFLNGFHDEECRDLLRRAIPTDALKPEFRD
jgi:hypothetical protein